MWQNYFKTGWSNLIRNRLFSGINIIGLSLGLAAFTLIMLFVRQEMTFDTFWHQPERIVMLDQTYHRENQPDNHTGGMSKIALPLIRAELEDRYFDRVASLLPMRLTVRQNGTLYRENVIMMRESMLDVFDLQFVEGSAEALNEPSRVAIPLSMARKFFGDQSALGGSIDLGIVEETVHTVGAVYEDLPQTTTLGQGILVPLLDRYFDGQRFYADTWQFAFFRTYVRLKPGIKAEELDAALDTIAETLIPQSVNSGFNGTEGSERRISFNVTPLLDMHLDPRFGEGKSTLYGLIAVAALVLAIAVVNFINLSLARTAYRAREVAVRRTVGARPNDVLRQFLAESMVVVMVSATLALAMVELAEPFYRSVLTQFLSGGLFSDPILLAGLGALALILSLGLGSAHASYFSLMDTTKALKGQVASDGGASHVRLGLVVAQFAIAIGLMTSSVIVINQTRYAQSMKLGFDAENMMIILGTNGDQSNGFKAALLEHPSIQSVSRASDLPTRGSEDRYESIRPSDGVSVTLDGLPVDQDFFRTFSIPLLAGRHLVQTNEADIIRARGIEDYDTAGNIVINASAAGTLGFASPETALGSIVTVTLFSGQSLDATIVGVVQDFHFDDAKNVIRPGIYYLDENRYSEMAVRTVPGGMDAARAHMTEVWQKTFPDALPTIADMPELVAAQYQQEEALGIILSFFTSLALVISAMGLYGLAAFTVERRTREIGIRKVLGASVLDMVKMLLWQFSKPILLASAVGLPIAYIFAVNWLSHFVYRQPLTPLPFIAVSLTALLIGWLTVAGHALKSGQSRPVDALRQD